MRKKEKMIEIDGHLFPERVDGMVLVDSYYIPEEEAAQYIQDREFFAQKATEVFAEFCHSVTRDWKGSQDGEAVLGLNKEGSLIALVHLDPSDVEMMKKAYKEGKLKEALLEINDLKPENK